MFESRIEGQARLKPSSMALARESPLLISSLTLSKIRILASTAMPIVKIKPAKPAKVMVTEKSLKSPRVRKT